ncbi:MAG: hypothetical protein HOB92_05580 [Candidatus Cloacimonetes bacterium]|nr:hypothetical protein [Candidatus Cloacimonadota bacterium]
MRFFFLFILTLMILSCNNTDNNEISKETKILNIYATDIFLNEDFYDNIVPLFTDIFKCEISITKFPNALTMLKELF